MQPDALLHRARGAYLGLAVGDALGATVEFMTPREIAHRYGVHRRMIGGGWLKLKPGQVTDDTEMSLALGQAILDSGGWDVRAAAEAFVAWLRGKPVDVGNACRRGIRRYMLDGSLAGPPSEAEGGNGACMRNLPVALAALFDEAAFAQATLAQCHLTHHHPLSDAATLALGRMTQRLLRGGRLRDCVPLASALIAAHPAFRYHPYPGRASGYIVDTVQTVLHFFFRTDSFESCLIEVVNRGEDADTTGALAGMLAGALHGADAIPAAWLKALDPHIVHRIERQVAGLLELARRAALVTAAG